MVLLPLPRAAVILEKAVCSLVSVVLLSSTHLVLCSAHTLFGVSNSRRISFMQKGYNGIDVPDPSMPQQSEWSTCPGKECSPVSSSAWKSGWMLSLAAELFLSKDIVLKNWRVTRPEGVVARGNLVCHWLRPQLVIGKSWDLLSFQ